MCSLKTPVKVLSAAALLGGLCAPWAMAVGAESARPPAVTSTDSGNDFYPTDAKRTAPIAEKCSDIATGGPVVP